MDLKITDKGRSSNGWKHLIVFVLVGVILVSFWAREDGQGPLNSIRSGVAVITRPIAMAGAALSIPFTAIGNGITNLSADAETITSLQQQNAELKEQLAEMEEYRLENERLTALLDLEDVFNIDGIAARVISQGDSSYDHTVLIGKGSVDGVVVGMPVMTAEGLIGQVDSVAPTTSRVRLLTDPDSGISAYAQNTRSEGIVCGSAEGLLYLNYVNVSVPVEVGEMVVTSGLGGTYPKGITIGQVVSVEDGPGAQYHTIVVSPLAKSTNFEEVLVVDNSALAAGIAGDGE